MYWPVTNTQKNTEESLVQLPNDFGDKNSWKTNWCVSLVIEHLEKIHEFSNLIKKTESFEITYERYLCRIIWNCFVEVFQVAVIMNVWTWEYFLFIYHMAQWPSSMVYKCISLYQYNNIKEIKKKRQNLKRE